MQSVFAIAGRRRNAQGRAANHAKIRTSSALLRKKRSEDELRAELAKFSDMRFAFANDMAGARYLGILTGEDADALSKTAALINPK